jgi:uncharacterized protein YcbX
MNDTRPTARVRELWRYPVKSMQGAAVDTVDVTPGGIAGDRAWAVVDAASGKALSAKTVAELLQATARAVDGEVHIDLPGRAAIVAGTPECNDALSGWLARDVELRRAAADAHASYEMTFDPPNDDAERFAIPSPDGTFFDLAALHVLTANSLAACAHTYPDGEWDRRRFRANVLVSEHGDEPFPEDAWVGRPVRIGGTTIDVLMRTVRCAMPLRAQPACGNDGPLARDIELYKAMDAVHENHLGVYASVREPGPIALGDEIVVG